MPPGVGCGQIVIDWLTCTGFVNTGSMGRARTITNEQILSAAREVFLEEGFGASTVEIARRAGISEGSIFKRFLTKENLFFAAMGIPAQPEWIKHLETLAGQGDLKENLVTLSLQILEFFQEVIPRMMMMAAKGNTLPLPPLLMLRHLQDLPSQDLHHPNPTDRPIAPAMPLPFKTDPALQELEAMTRFLQGEQALGRMGSGNPQITAALLLGSLMHYTFLTHMAGTQAPSIAPATYVEGVIDTLWLGIAPSQDA